MYGFSLIFYSDKWKIDTLKDDLDLPQSKAGVSRFVYSKLVKQNVFHYSYPFSYSQINWGRINVGMSLKKFDQNANDLNYRTLILALISILIGLFASIFFAGRLTRPIRQLDSVSNKVAQGDLNARVIISSKNEFGRLANSFNKMTQSLKTSQDTLEKKVEERTAELAQINKVLKVEINEKLQAENRLKQYNSRLEALDKIYKVIISAKSVDEIINETILNLHKSFPVISRSIVALVDKNIDNARIFCSNINNPQFKDDTLYQITEELKHDIFNLNSIKEFYSVADLSSVAERNNFENELYKIGIRSLVSILLVIDEQVIGFMNFSSDMPNSFNEENIEVLKVVSNQLAVAVYQAQLQEKIAEHSRNLQNSLSEKEVLLKEIHHRVKNNLQVISSLLYLNSKKIKDKETQELFKDSQNRVKSIALVHERLYQSKDLGKIDFKEYVSRLANDLFRSYAMNQTLVKLSLNINNIFISIDTAVPCGLIINEVVSNSFKYAFPVDRDLDKENEIKINFNKNGNSELVLEISDNGIGLPKGFTDKKKESLGLQLVDTLIAQLEGKMEINQNYGTTFKFTFKDLNK